MTGLRGAGQPGAIEGMRSESTDRALEATRVLRLFASSLENGAASRPDPSVFLCLGPDDVVLIEP